jgi:hypothetical protein
MHRTLGSAVVAAAVLVLLGFPAHAADLNTTIPRSTLDTYLVTLGRPKGGGSYTAPVSIRFCSLTRCFYNYASVPWTWEVASSRFVVAGSTATLEVVLLLKSGRTSSAQKVSLPVTALVTSGASRVELRPQSTPINVVFPSIAGPITVTSLDVAPRFVTALPLELDRFTALGRQLTPSLTNLAVAWSSDALRVSADIDVF